VKLKLSKEQLRRLRILYAFDIATKYSKNTELAQAIFEEGLNPEFMQSRDVLKSWNGELSQWQAEELKKSGKTMFGCFKIRRTAKGYIVFSDLVRVKK